MDVEVRVARTYEGMERVKRAQMISLVSYLTGGLVAVLIGPLNPYGLIIMLALSVASSMGASQGWCG